MRHVILFAAIIINLSATAQTTETLFKTLLSAWQQTNLPCLASFGDTIADANIDIDRYGALMPMKDEADVFWQGGEYMDCGNFVMVFLQHHNDNYPDGNNHFLMEDLVTEYVIATYSHQGELVDWNVIARKGTACHFSMQYKKRQNKFHVRQYAMDDMRQWLQYEDMDYTVKVTEYHVDKQGKIKARELTKGHHKEKCKETLKTPMSFKEFIGKFKETDQHKTTEGLFDGNLDHDLAYPKLRTVIPDTLLHNARNWARYVAWYPCCCIKTPELYICSLVMDCRTPKEEGPYAEYIIIVYDANGKPLKASKVSRDTTVGDVFSTSSAVSLFTEWQNGQ